MNAAYADRRIATARLLPISRRPATIEGHLRDHGTPPYQGRRELLAGILEDAWLTGRGGAAFPSVRKLRAVAAAGGRPVVVANGAEGEPASSKDKVLLTTVPHLVFDGLQLAVEAVGARTAYLYVHRHPVIVDSLKRALADRAALGLDRVGVRVVEAPSRFVAGEESAVVNRIDGGEAIPTYTPLRVVERGVGGQPTLVHNVETLAHVGLLARYGGPWFRELGTAEEPGTMLVTVHRQGQPGAVSEVPQGSSLDDVVRLDDAQALLIGGFHGAWLPAPAARGLRLCKADLREYGAAPGAGVLAVLALDRCGLIETARVVAYLAAEGAGQCGPCLNGLPRISAVLTALAARRASGADIADLQRWSGLVQRRGACHHPDGTVRLVASALTTYAREVEVHLAGRCSFASPTPLLPVSTAVPKAGDWR